MQENLAPSHIVANTLLASPSFLNTSLQSLDSTVSIPTPEISMFVSEQPNITIISAVVFLCASKLPGFSNFKLCLHSLDIQANSAKLAEAPDLFNVLSEYHKFSNIFRKTKAEVCITSKSIWKKMLNLQSALYTLFWHLNKRLSRNSLRKTSIWVSSD